MKADFIKYQAQTSAFPLGLEVSSAKGSYIYDQNNKAYLDLVAGISACTLGHSHKDIVAAIIEQVQKYSHTMVYGEFILKPTIAYCKALVHLLPSSLESVYMVNSGTEAVEGAIKLAKRVTGRAEIIFAKNAYHGNTMGAMSVMGYEERKSAFRPLIPGGKQIRFNHFEDISHITNKTAAVILETIQGGAGFICPKPQYLKTIKEKCKTTGTLLILDEIQPGFGRTGKLFAFEHYGVVPDILVIGKGMASGMPCGAFVSSLSYMNLIQKNPKLGHITTFGGHPVIACAALKTLEILYKDSLISEIKFKEKLFRSLLKHHHIKEIRGKGLMLALLMPSREIATQLVLKAKEEGVLLFWLLFEYKSVRITPPLTITAKEITKGCRQIIKILDML